MFRVVESWWGEQDQGYQRQLRQKLSRQGVQNGENHKEGVHDHGHGCGKPLGMHKVGPGGGKGSGKNAFAGHEQKIGKFAEQAVGGGAEPADRGCGHQPEAPREGAWDDGRGVRRRVQARQGHQF